MLILFDKHIVYRLCPKHFAKCKHNTDFYTQKVFNLRKFSMEGEGLSQTPLTEELFTIGGCWKRSLFSRHLTTGGCPHSNG